MKLALKSKIDTVKTGLKIKRERSEQAKAEFTVKKRELEQLKAQLEAKNKEKLVATAEKERLEKIEDVEKNLLREKKGLERAAKQKKEEDEEEEDEKKKKEAEENNSEEDENEWTHFKTEGMTFIVMVFASLFGWVEGELALVKRTSFFSNSNSFVCVCLLVCLFACLFVHNVAKAPKNKKQ